MRRFVLLLLTLFLVSCAETPYKGEKVSVTKSNCDCPKIKTEKEDLAKIPDYGLLKKSDWSYSALFYIFLYFWRTLETLN